MKSTLAMALVTGSAATIVNNYNIFNNLKPSQFKKRLAEWYEDEYPPEGAAIGFISYGMSSDLGDLPIFKTVMESYKNDFKAMFAFTVCDLDTDSDGADMCTYHKVGSVPSIYRINGGRDARGFKFSRLGDKMPDTSTLKSQMEWIKQYVGVPSKQYQSLGAGACLDASGKTVSKYYAKSNHCSSVCDSDIECQAYLPRRYVPGDGFYCDIYAPGRSSSPGDWRWHYAPGDWRWQEGSHDTVTKSHDGVPTSEHDRRWAEPQCMKKMASTGAALQEEPLPRGIIFENATDLQIQLDRNDEFLKEFQEGNYQSNMEVQRSVAHCPQLCDEWCWATSATMCASAFGGSTSCYPSEAKAATQKFHYQCPATSCPGSCNQPGEKSDIVNAIKLLSGHRYQEGGVLSQSDLDNALQHGPITLLLRWNGGGGHAVMIESVSGGTYKGFDPWPPQKGKIISASYSTLLRYGGSGRWTGTVYTSSSASIAV